MKEYKKIKPIFKKELKNFAETLSKYVTTQNGDWSVKGFIVRYSPKFEQQVKV